MNVKNRLSTNKILICVPCKDRAPIELTQCLMGMRLKVPYVFMAVKGSLISELRDMAAKEAISGEYSHLMFIDDDIVFPPDGVQKLYNCLKPIAAGAYAAKYGNHAVTWRNVRLEDNRLKGDTFRLKTPYQTADATGMGFTLIRTEVLKAVAKRFDNIFFPEWNAGEDISFCYRANQCGYKVHLDTSIDLYHLGTYAFGTRPLFE